MPLWNSFRRRRGRLPSGDTSVTLSSVSPTTSRLPGGAIATLRGFNFRRKSNGEAPDITIGGVAATGVVVVDGTTITFIVPQATVVGPVNIQIDIDGNTGVLPGGFVYFNETILSLDPIFGPIAGGTRVTIHGANFDTNVAYRVRFGDQVASDTVVVDSQTIVVTTPSRSLGFANVDLISAPVMFSRTIFSHTIFNVATQDATVFATLKNGFQFTLLVRGEDIRRTPGVSIQESLGAPPSRATFRIDGRSNAPIGGEKIQIRDEFDGDRLLWAGTVEQVTQIYEGQINQLAWDATCVDFSWLANSIRPVGAWFQVSASQVVRELIAKCCPGFTTNHVQTNLSKVTVVLDGSKDLLTVMGEIADAIGGGHFYFDFIQDFHFFHIVPASIATGVPGIPPTGSGVNPGSFLTLTSGNPAPFLVSYPRAFYSLRSQFVFADGTISALSPWSNLVQFDTSREWNVSNVPLGPTLSGNVTVKRRIWYHRFSAEAGDDIHTIRPFCEIDDNTTTAFTTAFGATGASVAAVVDMPANVPVPEGRNNNHPPGPAAPPVANVSSSLEGDPGVWSGNWLSHRYAFLYRDGSLSQASASSPPTGHQFSDRGFYLVSSRVGVASGPSIDTNNDCIARLVYLCLGLPEVDGFGESAPFFSIGYGAGNPNYKQKDPDWSNLVFRGFGVIPDNTTDHIHMTRAKLGGDPFFGAGSGGSNDTYFNRNPSYGVDFGGPGGTGVFVCDGEEKPAFGGTDVDFQFTPDPIPAWPNEDGPYLEDNNPPGIIDDNNRDLLHEDSGSQPFTVNTNRSQARNRIFVIGAGSTLTAGYVGGSLQLFVSDVTSFALSGGKLRIEDISNGRTEFAPYTTLQQTHGVPYIVLTSPLVYQYSQNSVVYNFYQADDVESQKFFARTELDSFGNPTKGIHEYTVTDSSLKTVWQLYMRAQAELELYSRPIITVNYATRDPDSRIGSTVHIDLTFPPCQGDFLIQSVTIDQIRDEGDQLSPRYTVTASSIRYDLNDLLLKILGQGGSVGVSVGGVANAGATTAFDGGSAGTGGFPKIREAWGQTVGLGLNQPPIFATQGTGSPTAAVAGSGGSFIQDVDEIPGYQDDVLGDRPQFGWATLTTTTSANSIASIALAQHMCGFLEDLPDVWFEFKTAKDLKGLAYWVGAWNLFPASTFGANIAIAALRFFDGVDNGWTAAFQSEVNAGGRTIAIPSGIGITPSTVYTVRMKVLMSGSDYRSMRIEFTINGTVFTVTQPQTGVDIAGSVKQAMPTAGHVTSNGPITLSYGVGVNNFGGGPIRKISLRRIYMTSGLS